MELGLARIQSVACAAGLDAPSFPIIAVAGTNGKGSTVAYISAILRTAGFRTGVYTSPHFIDFNERIVVDEQQISNDELCDAFACIESQRADTALTYFEFTTLVAIYQFEARAVDVAIMEVGLGGRLDAVNAWDSEVACVTSVGVDHVDWLGDNRESIGYEKAGIARAGKWLVCGDTDVPQSVVEHSNDIGAKLLLIEDDFRLLSAADSQLYQGPCGELSRLPKSAIPAGWATRNASVAICACTCFLGQLPAHHAVATALQTVEIPGRLQQVQYRDRLVLLDVAHNREAAAELRDYLGRHPIEGHNRAVFACMQDKDAAAVLAEVSGQITQWFLPQLDYPRAKSAEELEALINAREQPENDAESGPECSISVSYTHLTLPTICSV